MTNNQVAPAGTLLEQLRAERAKLQKARFAPNTIASYGYDWRLFCAWTVKVGEPALPASAETLSLYVAELLKGGAKIATVRRRCSGIAHHHQLGGFASPFNEEVRELLNCAQRLRAEKPRQMRPLTVEQLQKISGVLRQVGTARAIRDRAILVVGFMSALRRGSIAALQLADLEFGEKGLVISVGREKQDQAGRGRLIGIPRAKDPDACAVRCLADWLQVRGYEAGPVFTRLPQSGGTGPLTGEAIMRVVKRSVSLIGLDPKDRFAGHSLRAGFITAAGEAGASELLIAAQSGHRSMTVLRAYFRRTDLFRSNACAVLGL